jgi:TusA-related sulfurtransferase
MSDPKPGKTLDCIGLFCPQPLFQTRQELDAIEVGEVLEVLADDPAAEEDLRRLAKRTGQEILLIERKPDHIRILIKKRR